MTDQFREDALGLISDFAVGMFTQRNRGRAYDFMTKYAPVETPNGALPVEHELVDGWYFDADGQLIRVKGQVIYYAFGDASLRAAQPAPLYRLGRVAEYRPAALAEPGGLGAVVKDRFSKTYVRAAHGLTRKWIAPGGSNFSWDEIEAPITVLSEGVILP